ncbi:MULTISPECIES: hypothetical protein [Pantoea]|jgi:hypothetical protein|uniref:Uncharacterized protein n=2 Tax=Erwiniaceae TaxID=1903409 RepID=A0A653WSI4_9GAMM|nr:MULTISPECIES: hypothetical protein [Pantoea]KKD30514.1 hypothetical protein EP46_20470 [Pantoea sp. 3.5.1]MBS6035151.1 hypothetical protein [Pantoea sp.]MBZ6396417.1 hypothetical protein [Pantoea sp.]MBZ6439834.1 hypothetical protein [Pantoea sp.]MCQ5471515.1 hypothetical protein [Pantoea brenneri]
MYRSDDEKLTDVMIGEAVLTLLKSDKPVSSNALINQLELMAAETDEETKVKTIRKAITEVRNGMVAARKRASGGLPERENASHRLNNDGPPEGSKKH